MIANSQAKLLSVVEKTGKDKETGREFKWYENTLLSSEGVVVMTSGNNYTPLIEQDVLVTMTVTGLDKETRVVKLLKLERFDTELTIS